MLTRKMFGLCAVGCVVTTLAITGCGKKDKKDDTSSGQKAENAAALVLEVSTKIQASDIAAYGTTTQMNSTTGTAMLADNDMSSTYWSTGETIGNMYCGGDQSCGGESQFSSPKDFFDDQLNKNFKTLPGNGNREGAAVGVMGRLKNSMDLACTLVFHLGTGGGLPAAQTSNKTITKAMMTQSNTFCGSSMELPVDSVEISFTVTETSGQFARHIHLKSPFFENHVFLFDDGTTKRVMSTEVSDGGKLTSRWYLEYSSAAKISKLEGFERGFINSSSTEQGTLTYYRLTADENTKNVGVWGFYGASQYVSGVLILKHGTLFAGRGNKDQTNASIGFAELDSGAQNGSLRTGHPFVGCIAMDTGSFVSGGACSGFNLTATELNSSLTMIKDKILAKSASSDWKFDETISALNFTVENMTTLDPAY